MGTFITFFIILVAVIILIYEIRSISDDLQQYYGIKNRTSLSAFDAEITPLQLKIALFEGKPALLIREHYQETSDESFALVIREYDDPEFFRMLFAQIESLIHKHALTELKSSPTLHFFRTHCTGKNFASIYLRFSNGLKWQCIYPQENIPDQIALFLDDCKKFLSAAQKLHHQRNETSAAAKKISAEEKDPARMYLKLRDHILHLIPESIQSAADLAPYPCYGVLTEFTIRDIPATLVTLVDGTTSLYYGNGGGILGAGGEQKIMDSALDFIAFAMRYFPDATETQQFPLADRDQIILYFLSAQGNRKIEFPEKSTRFENFKYTELYNKYRDVVTAMQKICV